MTFGTNSNVLHYRSNGKIRRSLTSISLSFRTRQSAATLLHGQKHPDCLTLFIQDSHLVLELQAGADNDSSKVTVQSRGSVSDGEWHSVELSMDNQTLPSSRWIMALDGSKELSMSETAGRDLDFLKEGADISLGGQSLDTEVKLSGCLGSVEIGGLLLPFHLDLELKVQRPQEEQFVGTKSNTNLQYGCWGANVCVPNPCENEGVCEDLFDLHHCTCLPEWTGEMCQDPTDACVFSPCIFGNCTNLPGGFRCVCEPGYSGEQCELDFDTCQNSNCSAGATCLKGFLSYTCLCPQNMTGLYCG